MQKVGSSLELVPVHLQAEEKVYSTSKSPSLFLLLVPVVLRLVEVLEDGEVGARRAADDEVGLLLLNKGPGSSSVFSSSKIPLHSFTVFS